MSQQLNELLHEPPEMVPIMDDGMNISSVWASWFTNVRDTFNQFFPITTVQSIAGTSHVSLSMATRLSEADRDSLQSIEDGAFLYNTTSNKFNFRENGIWKEIP